MGVKTIHRVKETLAVLLLVLFVVSLTAMIVNAQQQIVSQAPNCYQSGNYSGYQKGYSDGFDIGYRCLIPSIHYPTPPDDQICTGSNKTAFDNGFRAGYEVGYNTGYSAGRQLCLK